MNTAVSLNPLLQWYYLIFLLPMGAAALLLTLSSLRLGGRHGHRDGGGHEHRLGGHSGGGIRAHSGHTPVQGHVARGGHGPKSTTGRSTTNSANAAQAHPHHSFSETLAALTGWARAPLPLLAGAFCLAWGLAGFWADRILIPASEPSPSFGRVLPAILIALAAGVVFLFLTMATAARLLPEESSTVVSRDALYGLTGRATFPIDTNNGRVRVYDEHNTLHDEACRVAEGKPPIPKGAQVIILDRGRDGRLIVEGITG